MSGRNVFFAISLVFGFCTIAGCSKESPVVEKRFTSLALSAFTVDSYRFRVSMSDEVLTDSLLAPEGQVGKEVFFSEFRQRIKVYNTSDESLIIDTPYTLNVGKINAFTIYQTQAGTTPYYLAPSPTEPLPAAGRKKISVVCTGKRLPDSVRVICENLSGGTTPKDTIVLYKDNFSKYFEVAGTLDTKISIYRIAGNQLLAEKIFLPKDLNSDFTIYRLLYEGTSTPSSLKLY